MTRDEKINDFMLLIHVAAVKMSAARALWAEMEPLLSDSERSEIKSSLIDLEVDLVCLREVSKAIG